MGRAGPSNKGLGLGEPAVQDPARDFLMKTATDKLSSAFGGFSVLLCITTEGG